MSKTKNQAAAMYIERANKLAEHHVSYVETFVTRGNDELYDLLGSLMSMCKDVLNSKDVEGVITGMRKALKDTHNVRPVKDSHPIKIICRYVVPKSRKTAHVYSRVILKAFDAGVNPSDLPAFIKNAGGVDAVRKSVANAEEKKAIAERVRAELSDVASKVQKRSVGVLNADAGKLECRKPKEVQFTYAICERQMDGSMKVMGTVYPSAAVEAEILSFYALTCKVAGLDDGTDEFKASCKEQGFNMDLVHSWMRDNNIASYKEAREIVGFNPNAKIKRKN